jgi:hypothetical protein
MHDNPRALHALSPARQQGVGVELAKRTAFGHARQPFPWHVQPPPRHETRQLADSQS